MNKHQHQSFNAYCAFCKTPRRIYPKKRSGMLEFVASAFIALVLSWYFFRSIEPQSVIFMVMSLVMSELFIQMRWRASILCSVCGFDPVLYVKSPLKAAEKVKKHLELREKNPERILARPINLPTISAGRAEEVEKSRKFGRVLSRQI